jgi:hypothetical protein
MFVSALVRRLGWRWLVTAATACVALGSIQLAVWHYLYGTFFTVPQGDGFLDFRHPQWLEVLFSLRHGLLVWHPMYLFCILGLALPARDLRFRVLALSCIMLQIYINSCTADWWAGNAFGNRRFIDVLPLFAVGGAAWLRPTDTLRVPATIVALLTAWNLLFCVQYRFGYIPRGDAISVKELTIDKFRLLSERRRF